MSRPKKMLPVLGQTSPGAGSGARRGRWLHRRLLLGCRDGRDIRGHPEDAGGKPRGAGGKRGARRSGEDRRARRGDGLRELRGHRGEARLGAARVSKATVNFAAGRLDAEHDPGLALEELEGAVRAAGYGVAKTEEAERTPFWRTPRALLTAAAALLFLAGLALSVAGAPEIARVGAYLAAIVVGGLPIFRAAVAGLRARHLDMNVLMSAATVGRWGSGSGRRPPRSWSSSPPATPCRSTP